MIRKFTFLSLLSVTLIVLLLPSCKKSDDFSNIPYTVTISSNPTNGGTATGGGIYEQGQSCMVSAMANTGYIFTNWTENGSVVSDNANYTFIINANRALVANFIQLPSWPNGVLPGAFSISDTQQIRFSQGNLQYQASSNTWRFAESQWDYIGNANSNISSTYSGWIDLFGWGTSGYNHGAICYQPWSTSQINNNYFAYGISIYNLSDSTGKADWGCNPISNGGNQDNQWRTLTSNEWDYLFNTRTTISGICYAKAKVNNINGLILVPDNWSNSTYSLNDTNNSEAGFSTNILTASQWLVLEQFGAVFLPAAGFRNRATVNYTGLMADYWSATCKGGSDVDYAYRFGFSDTVLWSLVDSVRNLGASVRLVRDIE